MVKFYGHHYINSSETKKTQTQKPICGIMGKKNPQRNAGKYIPVKEIPLKMGTPLKNIEIIEDEKVKKGTYLL